MNTLDFTQQLLGQIQSKKGERSAEPMPTPETSAALWSFRQAAAVLHCFRPDTLCPLNSEFGKQQAHLILFEDIVYAPGGISKGLFMLKPGIRREALQRLATRPVMQTALQANPEREDTPLQRLWESYLNTGHLPALDTLSYKQLTQVSLLVQWMDGIDKTLPDLTNLQNRVREKSALASFEHLAINNFVGRTQELAHIREHIGAMPPATTQDAVRRQLSQWFKLTRTSILAIHGPGGIGKSALVGRLLWEHTQGDASNRIPFAYLAFDQRSIRIDAPHTLLVEMAIQFDLQFAELAEVTAAFKEQVRAYQDQRAALGSRQTVKATREDRIHDVQTLDEQLYDQFVQLLQAVGQHRTPNADNYKIPILLVLDTFEEVQYRDRESLTGFWRMLDYLQEEVPFLRVIICGRASVSETGVDKERILEMPLTELEPEDRVLLLNRLGVIDPKIARAVAKQVGGSPLSLQLAADIIRKDKTSANTSGIKDLTTRKWLLFQVSEELIQGQLYRRILDHIHDEDVRKLAHPGMILRRVTPDIILKLLAPICQIKVETLSDAERLFDELKQEHTLVKIGEEGALLYRPEIRQAMIRLLKQDKFGEVRQLHRAAIAYYELLDRNAKTNEPNLLERAEEMYHRLALGENDTWQLDRYWLPGIEQSIAASKDDFSDEMKAWLASRMSLEVSRSIYENVNVAEWERNVTRKVQLALSRLDILWALELLGERTERSIESPLFALETKAHLLQKDLDRAWQVLEAGVKRVSESENRGRLAELFWLQAQVVLLRNEPEEADQYLVFAEKAVEKASNPIALLHILCHRLLLRQQFPTVYSDKLELILQARISEKINTSADVLTGYSDRFVVELSLSFLGDEFPKTMERFANFVKVDLQLSPDMLTAENLRGLEEYRHDWENENDNNIASESFA